MVDVFLKIVNMSISASWLVLVVLVFRLVFKKAPKWIHVLLWGIVAVRLLCPFSIESALSLIPSAETISPEIMMSREPTIHTGVPAINSVVNPIITETFAPEPVASANPLQILIPVLAMIWGIGVALLLAYTAISYWRLRRRVRMAVLLRDNIYQSEAVSSPFVLGIINPKIYLPFRIDGQNLEHVVSHEQAHIRRRDHWWKPLGFLLLTIHWFNPLMWLAYVLLCRDIEFACDEKVVKELGKDQRADYSQALLACSVNRRMIAACPLAFGEVGVKERVKSVLNYKKPAFWVIVVSAIACAVVAVCFLTNPSDDNHAPEPFSHSYRVKKIMYQDTRYSFGYTMDTAPQYQLTSDYQLFVSGDAFDGAGAGEWVQHRGAFKEVKLSELRFADYFKDPGNLSGWDGARYGADSIREQTKQAWRLEVDDVENGVFYYLILTHTDNVFLCYGYNVGDTDAAAEEDSLIRWVFELERTDLLTCNVISEGLDAFVELACFPDTDIDRDTDNWPVAQINESGTLRFSLEDDANTLVVSEDYYRKSEDSTFIERNTFEIARNDDGFFAIDIARRESLEDHVNYFIKIKGQSDVYAMKVVFDAASIDGEPKPAQLGGSQTLSLNDVIMLSQKGRDLTWSDFEQFKYIETGSGLYIRIYEIDEQFGLMIGGAPDRTPMYIYLCVSGSDDVRIDIRDGGVVEFISENAIIQKLDVDALEDLLKAFKESLRDEGTVIATDCVIATDGAYGLDGVVQYTDESGVPWKLAFIRDGIAYPVGLAYTEEHFVANGLTYLGNGAVQVHIENSNSGKIEVCTMEYIYDEEENHTKFRATTEDYDPQEGNDQESEFDQYYLTIGADDVIRIEFSMSDSSGGFQNADGSLLKKGEKIWLENLDGYPDLRGLSITAFNRAGEIIWSASIPDGEDNRGFTHLTQDGWTITNIK